MSNEILTMIGIGITLGLFIWRITGRLDARVDGLQGQINALRTEVHNLAREFSELRGEIRGSRT